VVVAEAGVEVEEEVEVGEEEGVAAEEEVVVVAVVVAILEKRSTMSIQGQRRNQFKHSLDI
jgi:hypothetical protein